MTRYYLPKVRKGFSVLQALILMFVKFLKRLLCPTLKIGRQKSKLLSKLSIFCLHRLGGCFTSNWVNWLVSWAKVSSVKSKQISLNLIGHWIGCLTNEIQDGANSFSVKNLRKPTVLALFSLFSVFIWNSIWQSV